MKDISKEYTNWLYKNMSQEKISENILEITTPFLNRHNDYIQIYINYISDGYIEINDHGYIIGDLLMDDHDIENNEKTEFLKTIIKKMNLRLKGEIIYKTVGDPKEIPAAMHSLIQALIYISNTYNFNK